MFLKQAVLLALLTISLCFEVKAINIIPKQLTQRQALDSLASSLSLQYARRLGPIQHWREFGLNRNRLEVKVEVIRSSGSENLTLYSLRLTRGHTGKDNYTNHKLVYRAGKHGFSLVSSETSLQGRLLIEGVDVSQSLNMVYMQGTFPKISARINETGITLDIHSWLGGSPHTNRLLAKQTRELTDSLSFSTLGIPLRILGEHFDANNILSLRTFTTKLKNGQSVIKMEITEVRNDHILKKIYSLKLRAGNSPPEFVATLDDLYLVYDESLHRFFTTQLVTLE